LYNISTKAINNKADAMRTWRGEETSLRRAYVSVARSLACSYLTCCRSAFTPETRSPEVVVGDLFYSPSHTHCREYKRSTHFTSGHRGRTKHKIRKKNIQKNVNFISTFFAQILFLFLHGINYIIFEEKVELYNFI